MPDAPSQYYDHLLGGSYDCVDRIVLNAYFSLGHSPGGFRQWWGRLCGSEDDLDDEHLMRMAGRFGRRVRGYAKAHGIQVVDCEAGERKHEIAEQYLTEHPQARGPFTVLVSRAPGQLWHIDRSSRGVTNIGHKKSLAFVNHYSFHILDPHGGWNAQ